MQVFVMTIFIALKSCIIYWLVGMRPGLQPLLYFIGVGALVFNIAYSMAQIIVVICKSLGTSRVVYCAFMGWQVLTNGLNTLPTDLPLQLHWMLHTSAAFCAIEALTISEMERFDFGLQYLTSVGKNPDRAGVDIQTLVAMIIVLRFGLHILFRIFNEEWR